MNHLFWGLIFVLLDYKVNVGKMVVEVLPDFLGWYLVMRGMESLAERSKAFDRGRHWAFGLSIAGGILWGADLMSPDALGKVWLWALGLAMLAVMLGMLRVILRGMEELGRNTERLRAVTLILVVLLPLCYLVSWVPLVGSVCEVAAAVVAALYLIVFFGTLRKSAE